MNRKRNKYQKRVNIQLTVAVMLCLAGLSLLFMGFWCTQYRLRGTSRCAVSSSSGTP